MSTSFATRHRLIVIGAAATLAAGTFVATNLAGAASGPSAVDYAQCANGAPGTSPANCSWINGVLNANNSQYHEDQVTPQRLMVQVTDGGAAGDSHSHSVTLTYLDRKGGIHAYDYLATIPSGALADRCIGLPSISGVCPDAAGLTTGSEAITPDDTPVPPFTSGADGKTSSRETSDTLTVFGADFAGADAMTQPLHTNAGGTGDDYATTKISFTTHGPGVHNVQLLFGGHLAAGTQSHGWGVGLGAAGISGGPYHIKWAAADDASVGNRDNQIMSGAILPIVAHGVGQSTTPSPSGAVVVGSSSLTSISDSATVTVNSASHQPIGTETFDLYGPLSTQPHTTDVTPACVDSGTGANLVTTLSTTTFTEVGSTTDFIATPASGYDLTGSSTFAPGWYQWVAHFAPSATDLYNLAFDGDCGDVTEQLHVTRTSPTGASAQTVTDAVTVSGLFVPSGGSLGGSFTFNVYSSCAAGSVPIWTDSSETISSGVVSSTFTPSTDLTPAPGPGPHSYYWEVTYSGDTWNSPETLETCGVEQFTIQDAAA